MSKYFKATIKWNDGDVNHDCTFKMGDVIESEDDSIFFYIEKESAMDDLKVHGVEDFTVLHYEEYKIN